MIVGGVERGRGMARGLEVIRGCGVAGRRPINQLGLTGMAKLDNQYDLV